MKILYNVFIEDIHEAHLKVPNLIYLEFLERKSDDVLFFKIRVQLYSRIRRQLDKDLEKKLWRK